MPMARLEGRTRAGGAVPICRSIDGSTGRIILQSMG
jgi:hypothetical protein